MHHSRMEARGRLAPSPQRQRFNNATNPSVRTTFPEPVPVPKTRPGRNAAVAQAANSDRTRAEQAAIRQVVARVSQQTSRQWQSRRPRPWQSFAATPLCGRIQAAIDEANEAASQAEAIKRFAILGEDFNRRPAG
jgi:hypothetical protein